ncbi:MAG: hypothetical protein AB8H47_22940 [Bacteroidia bacterium]
MKASYIGGLILMLCWTQIVAANTFYFKTLKVEVIEEGKVIDENKYPHFLSIGEAEGEQWRFQWHDPQGPINVIDLAEPDHSNTDNGSFFRFKALDKTIANTLEMEISWNKQDNGDGRFYNCIITLIGEGIKVKFYCLEDKAEVLNESFSSPASGSLRYYSQKQLHISETGEKQDAWKQYQFDLIENQTTSTATLKQSLTGQAKDSWQLRYVNTKSIVDSDGVFKVYTYQNGTFIDTVAILQYPSNHQQDAYDYNAIILISNSTGEGVKEDLFLATLDISKQWNAKMAAEATAPEPSPEPVLSESSPEPEPEAAPKPKQKKKSRERGSLSDSKELSLTIGSNPHNLVYDAGWLRRIKIGRVGNIQLGLRLGLTQGEGFDFSNVPLSRDAYLGPIDSFRMDKWQTHSLNALLGLELNLGRRLRVGGRVDIGGVSGGLFQLGSMIFLDGPDDMGVFLPGTLSQEQGMASESVPITVTQFAKIWGSNPSGNLAGEVYLRLRILRGLSLRGGMRLNQYSLTTKTPLGVSKTQDFLNYDQTWFLGLQLHLMSDW